MMRRKWIVVSLITAFAVMKMTSAAADLSACASAYGKSPNDQIRLYTICLHSGLSRLDRASAYYYRGTAYMMQGDLDHALADFTHSIENDSKWGTAYLNRASIYRIRGKRALEEADLDAVVRKRPAQIRGIAYAMRARLKADRGDRSGANKDLDAAVAHGRRSATTLNRVAWFLATYPNAGYRDGKRAVSLALRADKLSKNSYSILDTLAAAYAEAGLFNDAVQVQKRVIDLVKAAGGDTGQFTGRLSLYQNGKPYYEAR